MLAVRKEKIHLLSLSVTVNTNTETARERARYWHCRRFLFLNVADGRCPWTPCQYVSAEL